jgi:hypothetical protein
MKNKKIQFKLFRNIYYLLFLIILYFLCILYPSTMIPFSHTILGRFLAIVIIIIFTQIDFTLGLFACVTIIYYYQMDKFKYILNMPEGFVWDLTSDPDKQSFYEAKFSDVLYQPYEPEVYNDLNNSLKEKFKKEHCKNGNIINNNSDDDNKEYHVRDEMVQHIFPQIEFAHDHCNPCNPMCKFSIIENKFRTEEEIMKPKNSNDWVAVIVPKFR